MGSEMCIRDSLFGRGVERVLGSLRFLLLYLGSGLAATVLHISLSIIQGVGALTIPAIGASGAISGVLGAYLLLFPRTSLTACWFFFYFPVCFTIKAAYYLIFWFATQVIYGYARLGAAVAFFAHAGGFLGGMALLLVLRDKARHLYIKSRAISMRLFDYITYEFRGFRELGLGGSKVVLVLLIMALLAGAGYAMLSSYGLSGAYMMKASVNYVQCSIRGICSEGYGEDTLILDSKSGKALNTPVNDMVRVLLNRLEAAGLLFNKSLSNWQGSLTIDRYVNVANVPVRLKLVMDSIFNVKNFRNEIVWCYKGPGRSLKDFPDKHDIILRYSKVVVISFR